jgi:hypothetical protein
MPKSKWNGWKENSKDLGNEMTETTMGNYIKNIMTETTMDNNIMKTKTLRMLMEELEETEQKASKIRTQINNVLKLKND